MLTGGLVALGTVRERGKSSCKGMGVASALPALQRRSFGSLVHRGKEREKEGKGKGGGKGKGNGEETKGILKGKEQEKEFGWAAHRLLFNAGGPGDQKARCTVADGFPISYGTFRQRPA